MRALFLNDTSRNGGPGRTLFYILKFLEPARIHRTVIVPRAGVVSELLLGGKVVDDLHFLPNLVENVDRAVEPPDGPRGLLRAAPAARGARRWQRGAWNVGGVRAHLARASHARSGRLLQRHHGELRGRRDRPHDGVPVVWHAFYPVGRAGPSRGCTRGSPRRRTSAQSSASRSRSRSSSRTARDKVRVIHDAIDTDEFAPDAAGRVLRKELGYDEGTMVFGSQGRILPRKGYLEMVRAARLAVDRMPDDVRSRVRFVVLGDTPSDMRPDHLAECRAEVKKLGLDKTFEFLGYRPDVARS